MLQETNAKKSRFTNSASHAENEANEQNRFAQFADWLVNDKKDILVINDQTNQAIQYRYVKVCDNSTLDLVYTSDCCSDDYSTKLDLFAAFKHTESQSSLMMLKSDLVLWGLIEFKPSLSYALAQKGISVVDINDLQTEFSQDVQKLIVDYAWKNQEALTASYISQASEADMKYLDKQAMQKALDFIWNQHFNSEYSQKDALSDFISLSNYINATTFSLDITNLINYFVDPLPTAQLYMDKWIFDDGSGYSNALSLGERLLVINKASKLLKNPEVMQDLKQRDKIGWTLANTQAVNVRIFYTDDLGGDIPREASCPREVLISALKDTSWESLSRWKLKPVPFSDIPFVNITKITYRGKTLYSKDKD